MPEANPLVLTFLELPKHAKSEDIPLDRMTPLQRWLTFLCARSDKELEELRMLVAEFDEAISETEAKRKVLLKLAAKKFGPALAPAEAALQSKLLSLGSDELDAMIDRVIDAQTVAEIL